MMNAYLSAAIINVSICVYVGLVAYFTKSPWALLGLAFLFRVEGSF
jgi:hypothetical protein